MAAYAKWVDVIGTEPAPMREDYAQVLAKQTVFVAETAGHVVGGVVLAPAAEGFLLENIAVHPELAGRGIGSRLLATAEQEAAAQGFASIYLYTHALMLDNIAIYRNAGYVEYARRTEGPYARVYMRKQLAGHGA